MWYLLTDAITALRESVFAAPSQYPIAGFGLDWALNILKGLLEGFLEFITNQFLGKVEKYLHISPQAESTAVRDRYIHFAAAAVKLSPIYLILAVATGPFYDAQEYSIGRLFFRYGLFIISLPLALEMIPIFMMIVNALTDFIYPSTVNMSFGQGGIYGELQGIGLSTVALVMGGYFVGMVSLITAFIGLLGLQAREVAYVALYVGYPFFSLARVATWGPFRYAHSVSSMFMFTCASLVMVGPIVALGVAAGSVLMAAGSSLGFWERFLTWFVTLAIAGYIPLKTASSVSFTMGQLSGDSGESSDESESVETESGAESSRSLKSQAGSAARRAGSRAKQSFNSMTGGRFQKATAGMKGAAAQVGGATKGAISDRAPDGLQNSAASAADSLESGASRASDVGKSMAETVADNPNASMGDIANAGGQPLRDDPVFDGDDGTSDGSTTGSSEKGYSNDSAGTSTTSASSSQSGSSTTTTGSQSSASRQRGRSSTPYDPSGGGASSGSRPKDRPPKMKDINFNP